MTDQPIKLLHVMTVPLSLRFLRGQPDYFRQQGIDTSVLTSGGELLDEFAEQEAIHAYPVEMKREISPIHDLFSLLNIIPIMKQLRPDIVHAHTPKGGLLGMIASWLTRVPIRIYHLHGLPLETATGLKLRILTFTEKLSCRLATEVLCVSPSLREQVIQRGLCPSNKVKVLGQGSINGIDSQGLFNPQNVAQSREAIRAELNIPPDASVIGFVGRFVQDKGIAELKSAWDVIRAEYPNAYLLAVGGMEGEHGTMAEIFSQLQADDRARMMGFVYDLTAMPYFYKAMDFLICPSYREGMSLAPLEASSMGIPTIASQITGNRDAVVDGVTGVLIPVRQVAPLVEAIRAYLDDPARCQAHGKAGRERVNVAFRQEVIWDELGQTYQRLLREKHSHH